MTTEAKQFHCRAEAHVIAAQYQLDPGSAPGVEPKRNQQYVDKVLRTLAEVKVA